MSLRQFCLKDIPQLTNNQHFTKNAPPSQQSAGGGRGAVRTRLEPEKGRLGARHRWIGVAKRRSAHQSAGGGRVFANWAVDDGQRHTSPGAAGVYEGAEPPVLKAKKRQTVRLDAFERCGRYRI